MNKTATTRSQAPSHYGIRVCNNGMNKTTTTRSQAPHHCNPQMYNRGEKRRLQQQGIELLLVTTLACAIVQRRKSQ